MNAEEYINKYINKDIKNIESVCVGLSNLYDHEYSKIDAELKSIPKIDINKIHKIIDAHKLLVKSSKIEKNLQVLLNNSHFIDKNPNLILDLAKLFFYSSKIELKDNQIVIIKEMNLPTVREEIPEINEVKVISMVLKKIKYNRLQKKDLAKINELKEYDNYKNLHQILFEAIDKQTLIKMLNDDELNKTYHELKTFLDN